MTSSMSTPRWSDPAPRMVRQERTRQPGDAHASSIAAIAGQTDHAGKVPVGASSGLHLR